jgi:hypothetical protein
LRQRSPIELPHRAGSEASRSKAILLGHSQPGTISTGMKPAATEPARRSAITSATASSPTMMKVTAASVTLG